MQSLEPKHSLLQNVLAKGTLNIFNALLPLVIVPYVYRILGPAQMGDIEYANTIYSYFGMLGLLGIYNYGLREISKNRNNPSEVRDIYKNLFTIGLLSNGICIAIYTTFIALFIQSPQLKIIGYILTANLVSQLFYVEWVNEAFEEFRFITIKTVVIRSLSLLAIFLFVKQASDAIIYVWIISGVCVANYAVSYWYAQRNIRLSLRETFSGLSLKKYIIPLFIILILNNTGILYTIADRIILGHYTGTESVAFFSIGQKIVEVVKTLLLSVVFATLPRLAFYLEGDKHLYQAGIIKLMRLVLATIIPAGIGMFMLSHNIIWLFGGEKYLSGVSAMRVFSLRIILLGIGAILYNQIIFLHGKEKILALLNILCGGLNVGLNFLFLGFLNPFISILCTFISEIIFETTCALYIHYKLKISVGIFSKETLRYVCLSLTFIPVIWLIKQFELSVLATSAIAILGCGTIYAGSLSIMKDETFQELTGYVKRIIIRK